MNNVEERFDPLADALSSQDYQAVVGGVNEILRMAKQKFRVEDYERNLKGRFVRWMHRFHGFGVAYSKGEIPTDEVLDRFRQLRQSFPEGIEIGHDEIVEEDPQEDLEALRRGHFHRPPSQEVSIDLRPDKGRIADGDLYDLIVNQGLPKVPIGGYLVLEMGESPRELQGIGYSLWVALKKSIHSFMGEKQVILRNSAEGKQIRIGIDKNGEDRDFLTIASEDVS